MSVYESNKKHTDKILKEIRIRIMMKILSIIPTGLFWNWMPWKGIWGLIFGYFALYCFKLYAISLVHKCCNRGFSISSNRWLLSMGTRGLWSVIIVKLVMPMRQIVGFTTAHATPSNCNSKTAYFESASLRKWDPVCTRVHSPVGVSRQRTNPMPWRLASVLSCVVVVGWGYYLNHVLCTTTGFPACWVRMVVG